jgi:pyruvate kinase
VAEPRKEKKALNDADRVLRQRLEELTALHTLASRSASTRSLDKLVDTALELGVGTLAVSYAAVPGILQATRETASTPAAGPPVLVAKLEQPEALDRIEDILASSDALWLCRGDLGAEVGLAQLPALQRALLDATLGRTTVLVAGQVLHHMTVSPRPTRSEVCHVGDLVERGVAGFVLSDETATGPHGPEAVRVLRQITREVS